MEKKMSFFPAIRFLVLFGLMAVAVYEGYQVYQRYVLRIQVLQQIASRLKADSRIAEVLVTDVRYNPITQANTTTIKFLEYDGVIFYEKQRNNRNF